MQAVLSQARPLLKPSESSSIVIADVFAKSEIEGYEKTFGSSGFKIQKKEVITFNVKHAMQLDKPRVEKYINLISMNPVIKMFLRNFFASAEESKTYQELGKNKEYICYVLKLQNSS
jgi:hypothetical protein